MIPLVAALIQGGLGLLGNAVLAKGKEVVEEKLGVDITAAMSTEQGRIQLKQLETAHEEALNQFVLAQREQELKADQMAYADTNSAREMNTKINESANASWLAKNVAAVLALLVVMGGGTLLATTKDADVRTAVVGLMTLVLGFYFGSSVRSQSKDDTIAKLAGGTP